MPSLLECALFFRLSGGNVCFFVCRMHTTFLAYRTVLELISLIRLKVTNILVLQFISQFPVIYWPLGPNILFSELNICSSPRARQSFAPT